MKALVVDDDGISRMVLFHLLGTLGIFDVIEADDGEVAWQLMDHGLVPSICFCDGRMPHLSGIGLLLRMQANPSLVRVPFVLVSASEDQETVEKALNLGASGYIVKPFEVNDVRTQLFKHVKTTWQQLAETPLASLKRLNLSPQQMHGYLQAFAFQVEQGGREIGDALDGGEGLAKVMPRIQSLQHACQTLGLSYAAQVLAGWSKPGMNSAQLTHDLRTVKNTIAHQASLVKAMLPNSPTFASNMQGLGAERKQV